MDGGLNGHDQHADLTYRAALHQIVSTCEHALKGRVAKRFATRDALKALEARARKLLAKEDGRDFDEEFSQVFECASALFDELVVQAGGNPEEMKGKPH